MRSETSNNAFTHALERAFGMEADDATAVAELVQTTFDGRDEIRDEDLDTEVRAVFYTLEAKKLLAFRRAEVPNENGQKWRTFYWRIRAEELTRLTTDAPGTSEVNVYDQLPAGAWSRHAMAF